MDWNPLDPDHTTINYLGSFYFTLHDVWVKKKVLQMQIDVSRSSQSNNIPSGAEKIKKINKGIYIKAPMGSLPTCIWVWVCWLLSVMCSMWAFCGCSLTRSEGFSFPPGPQPLRCVGSLCVGTRTWRISPQGCTDTAPHTGERSCCGLSTLCFCGRLSADAPVALSGVVPQSCCPLLS